MLVTGVVVGSIYGLVALGFVLIYRASGALNLANGEFVIIGPYICLILMTAYKIPFHLCVTYNTCFQCCSWISCGKTCY